MMMSNPKNITTPRFTGRTGGGSLLPNSQQPAESVRLYILFIIY
jgi:hypothetical protein